VPPSRNDSASHTPARPILSRLGRAAAALALAFLAALPVWSYLGVEANPAARVMVAGMAVAAALSPASALLVCGGLLPLTGPLTVLLGCSAPYSIGEPLVLAFLAGWLLGIAARPPARAGAAHGAILAPVLALAVAVAASGVVQLYLVQPAAAQPRPFAAVVFEFLFEGYFRDRTTFAAIPAAAFFLEALGLFAAGLMITGRIKAPGTRLLEMVACGAAGVGAFSLVRLVTVSLRQEEAWAALAKYLQTIRISAAFPDPNAAGSYLAMCLPIAAGLSLASQVPGTGPNGDAPRRPIGLFWLAIIPIIAVGLWLTGSRAALLAIVPALVLLVPLARRAPKGLARGGAALVVLAAAASLPFLMGRLNPPATTGRSLSNTFNFRTEMTRMAFRMIAAQPVFGVGVGRFHASSGEYFSPSFRTVVPRENAHNNFLQVLGELGLVGFVPFVWVLWAVAAAVTRAWRAGRLPAAAVGGAAGLVAFVLTWLTGHPLLIFEVATAFWLVLGAVAALAVADGAACPAHGSKRSRAAKWAAILLIAATIGSIPFRGHVGRHRADLGEAIGIGRRELAAPGGR
jgi:O-antigen ligase